MQHYRALVGIGTERHARGGGRRRHLAYPATRPGGGSGPPAGSNGCTPHLEPVMDPSHHEHPSDAERVRIHITLTVQARRHLRLAMPRPVRPRRGGRLQGVHRRR